MAFLVVFYASTCCSMESGDRLYSHPLTTVQKMILNQVPIINLREIEEEALYGYPLDTIVKRFMKEYQVSQLSACNTEMEFKIFLVKAAKAHSELPLHRKNVIQFWRTFILHTREYHLFCYTFFGRMIHFNPSISDSLEQQDINKESPKRRSGTQLLHEILTRKNY